MNEDYQSIHNQSQQPTGPEGHKAQRPQPDAKFPQGNEEVTAPLHPASPGKSDLQDLMASAQVGMLFLDREFRILRHTLLIEAILNLSPHATGKPLSQFSSAEQYDLLFPAAYRVLHDLQPSESEIMGQDGRWYLMRIQPEQAQNEVAGVFVFFIDITKPQQTQKTRFLNEHAYRILLDNIREYAIFMMDTERRITVWNTGPERIFGYSPEEIIGQSADVIFTDPDRAEGIPQREMELAQKRGETSDERPHRSKDGSIFWASGILAALYDSDGKLYGYAKLLRDNTDRRIAQDRLRELNESLETRVKERTRQVRVLASTLTMAEQEERRRISQILHDDLQQLLYSVQMKLTLLAQETGKSNPDILKNKTIEACTSIREAIKTTRELSVDLSPPVLKGEGLTEALEWLIPLMEDVHNIKVDLTAPEPFCIPNEDMRVLLFQIVRELLFNIVKHAGTDQARVQLDMAKDNGIQIRISDNGRGFDVRAAEKRRKGFGLFSVRERLSLFGGSMIIESSIGKGSCITLNAPIDPGRETESDSSKPH